MNIDDDLKEMIQSGMIDSSVINDLYKNILEMGDVYLALTPSQCGAPPYCGTGVSNVCTSSCACKC